MKVLVSGATGLIGSAFCKSLEAEGHEVLRLSRRKSEGDVYWQPDSGRFEDSEKEKLNGMDAAVHLAGEPVVGRWNDEKKRRIRESRVGSTRLLCQTLALLPQKPRVIICASAIGYYGDRGDEVLTEESTSGAGFLASVCRDWEAAAEPARAVGIRVVHARIGVVLSKDGGALQKMLLPFKLGLGGTIGSGEQYLSWIAIHDAVRALQFALRMESIGDAMNVVGSAPVTNREFVQTLGEVLRRPAMLPLPAFAARIALGQQAADELFLASQRVLPEKLFSHGFGFEYSDLEAALRGVLRL